MEKFSYPDELEIIIMKSGFNKHITAKFDAMKDATVVDGEKEYRVTRDNLFRRNASWVYKKFHHINNCYVAFFNEGSDDPIKIDFTETKASSRIVYFALQSRSLKGGISSLFKGTFSLGMSWKTLVMIIAIAGVVAGLVMAYQSGLLNNLLGGAPK